MPKLRNRSAPAMAENHGLHCPKILTIDPLGLSGPPQLPIPPWYIEASKRKYLKEKTFRAPDTPKEKWYDQESKKRLVARLARLNKPDSELQDGRKELLTQLAKRIDSLSEENLDNAPEKNNLILLSDHKAEINRALGTGKVHGSDYLKLLEQSVSQDATIQRVLPMVVAAATDINLSDEERSEAAKAIIAFTVLRRDTYNIARSDCKDKSDKQSEALMDLIYFYDKVDGRICSLACEVYSRVAEIDRLEKKLDKKKEEMKELVKREKKAAFTTAIGSLVAAPVIELFLAPGLVGKVLPFYLAIVGIVTILRLIIMAKKSLVNLADQQGIEAEQEEKRRELDCLALPEPA